MSDLSHSDEPAGGRSEQPIDPAVAARFRELVKSLDRGSAAANAEQFEAATFELLTIAAEHAAKNPTPEDDVGQRIEAAEAVFDWDAALHLRQEWVKAERREKESGVLWMALVRLSGLLRMLDRAPEAMPLAEEALSAARREDLGAAVAHAAQNAADCALDLGQADRALEFAQEAAAALQASQTAGAGLGRLAMAWNQLVLARCHLAQGDVVGAEEDLAAAQPQFERLAECKELTGIQSRLAACWEVAALIHQEKGETSQALDWLRKAVAQRQSVLAVDDYRRHVRIYQLVRTLHRFAQVLDSAHLPDEAGQAREALRGLCEFAHLPPPK